MYSTRIQSAIPINRLSQRCHINRTQDSRSAQLIPPLRKFSVLILQFNFRQLLTDVRGKGSWSSPMRRRHRPRLASLERRIGADKCREYDEAREQRLMSPKTVVNITGTALGSW